jgi:hypothetical protein
MALSCAPGWFIRVQGRVITSAARRVHICGEVVQPSTSSSRDGSATSRRAPASEAWSASAQPSNCGTQEAISRQTASSGRMRAWVKSLAAATRLSWISARQSASASATRSSTVMSWRHSVASSVMRGTRRPRTSRVVL